MLGQFQLNLGTTYTRSLVFVFVLWRYASVSPIGSEWTGLHTIRSSTHALSWAKKTPKTVLKGSTSLEAATRRPFKCFQLKNYSTLIFKKYNYNTVSVNTAKLHALSSAVVYRCHLLNMLPRLLRPWCWEVQIHPGARAGYLVAAGTKELPPFFHNHGHNSISISFDQFQFSIFDTFWVHFLSFRWFFLMLGKDVGRIEPPRQSIAAKALPQFAHLRPPLPCHPWKEQLNFSIHQSKRDL